MAFAIDAIEREAHTLTVRVETSETTPRQRPAQFLWWALSRHSPR
jgi:hypothetical protein